MAKDKPKFKGAGQQPGDPRGRRMPQTEAKAKGLVGWRGGKRASKVSSVGDYKGKTLNLTAKQLANSGVKGARKAAKNTVSISDTKYEKGRGVLGKDGKALNGMVDLGGGNMAVYVNGKRVRAGSGQPAAPPRGGSFSGSKTGSDSGTKDKPPKVKPPKVGETRRGPQGYLNKWDGKKWVPATMTGNPRVTAAARRGEAAARRSGRTVASGNPGTSASAASTVRATGMAPSRPAYASPKSTPGRDTGNHKPTIYGNGTARVWDPKQRKFIVVSKGNPLYPK